MPLFSCPNPTCGRPFSSSKGLHQHIIKNDNCAKYAAATRLFESSSDESDSGTDGEENIVDDNDNFSMDIDDDDGDDDDDNSTEAKRQRIGELLNENENEILEDGSFPISKEKLIDMMTPEQLPPRTRFQFSLLCLLSHPSIPLYIYPEVIRLINEMIDQNQNDNSSQFDTPFPTSRDSILKKIRNSYQVRQLSCYRTQQRAVMTRCL